MERLTNRSDDGQAFMNCEECEASWCKKSGNHKTACTAIYCRNRLKDRLAAYEDTGIDPDELRIIGDIKRFKNEIIFGSKADRLKELSDADKDGRLVVLPCKVVCGTTIWWADSSIHADPIKCEVSSFGIYTGPDGDLQVWMNCYVYGPTPMSKSFRMSSIGKTVFLTREEAEVALAQEGGTHEADSV